MSETMLTVPSWPPSTAEVIERRRQAREQQESTERERDSREISDRQRARAGVRRRMRAAALATIRLAEVDRLIAEVELAKVVASSDEAAAGSEAKTKLDKIDVAQMSTLETGGEVDEKLEAQRRQILDDQFARGVALKTRLVELDDRLAHLSRERIQPATDCHVSGLETELFELGDPELKRQYHSQRRSGFARSDELAELYQRIISE